MDSCSYQEHILTISELTIIGFSPHANIGVKLDHGVKFVYNYRNL